MLKDCPVVSQDVDVSLKVWGKQVPMLKGSTVRCKAPVVREDVVEVPKEIRLLHKRVTLTINIFLKICTTTTYSVVFRLCLSKEMENSSRSRT